MEECARFLAFVGWTEEYNETTSIRIARTSQHQLKALTNQLRGVWFKPNLPTRDVTITELYVN